jgi:hypothetical protein
VIGGGFGKHTTVFEVKKRGCMPLPAIQYGFFEHQFRVVRGAAGVPNDTLNEFVAETVNTHTTGGE